MPFVAIHSAEQRQQMLELLREGFPEVAFDWSVAFQPPPGRSGHGLLLIVDGRPQGGILSFEKTETIDGRERRFVNLSSWYIRPKYRSMALRMMRAASSDPDTIYTICTPIRSVQAICIRLGFRYLSHGSILSVPLLNGLIGGHSTRIEPLTLALAAPEHRRWIADHSDTRHIGIIIRQEEHTAPALWLRRPRFRGISAARLLFTSEYAMLRAALPAVHMHMLRHHGIVGLYLPRTGPLMDLRSVRRGRKGPSIVVKGDIADTDINLLYTELLYLPQ